MSKIVYYVATSLDGYIAGPEDDITAFAQGGDGVEQYFADLQHFKTVIMGRRTYEFGYQYGLVPGQPAYPHMEHFIFSESLVLKDQADSVHVVPTSLAEVQKIKSAAETDIYLCGGGAFAGWLLENGMIDTLKIKLNPIVLGGGIRLFGASSKAANWQLEESKSYDSGLMIIKYQRANS